MNPYQELIAIHEELERRKRRKRLFDYYPDEGPLRRDLYQKHQAFFRAGSSFRERAAIAANRVGKSEGMGGYEIALHLTGLYPDWWQGRRFDHPIEAWASGKTSETTRDIIQQKLLGPPDRESEYGTGLIPGDCILGYTRRRNIPNAVETIQVRHKSGGISTVGLKSYEQGRGKFEGTSKHVVWYDEEPPMDIYTEGLMRTMDCNGMVMCTFTPLEGLSDVVLLYMPGGKAPDQMDSRFVVFADWNDVPHLSEQAKKELYDSLPPHEREARSKGIPALGSGAIYPISEETIVVDDRELPPYWPRAFGMDVGWNRTAAIFGAHDRESDCLYLYSAHYQGQAEPAIHAAAIGARGEWIPGVIDPAANGRNQKDGERLIQIYQDLHLNLTPANNAVEAGIYETWQRMSTGRLKVFRSLKSWFDEFRIYRRDEKGKIVKENDHLMDATRYLVMSGISLAVVQPSGAGFRRQGSWRTV